MILFNAFRKNERECCGICYKETYNTNSCGNKKCSMNLCNECLKKTQTRIIPGRIYGKQSLLCLNCQTLPHQKYFKTNKYLQKAIQNLKLKGCYNNVQQNNKILFCQDCRGIYPWMEKTRCDIQNGDLQNLKCSKCLGKLSKKDHKQLCGKYQKTPCCQSLYYKMEGCTKINCLCGKVFDQEPHLTVVVHSTWIPIYIYKRQHHKKNEIFNKISFYLDQNIFHCNLCDMQEDSILEEEQQIQKYNLVKKLYWDNGQEAVNKELRKKCLRQIVVHQASIEGDIGMLELWYEYHIKKKNSEHYMNADIQSNNMIELIVYNNLVKVLQWYYVKCVYIFDMNVNLIQQYACEFGQLQILDWCRSKKNIKWYKNSMNLYEKCQIAKKKELIEWWYENKDWTKLEYDKSIIDQTYGDDEAIIILTFYWEVLQKDIGFEYTEQAINNSVLNGDIEVLEWWYEMRKLTPMKYSYETLVFACQNDQVEFFEWFYQRKENIEMKICKSIIEIVCELKSFQVLEWLLDKNDLNIEYDKKNTEIKKYLNVLNKNKFILNKQPGTCQICLNSINNEMCFECCNCKKKIHQWCYEKMKLTKNKLCQNCRSNLFVS